MLYYLLYRLHETVSFFNIFRYITFRAAMAAMTAFVLSLIFGPSIIRMLKNWRIGEKIRKEESQRLYELHREKQDTPTMGGIFILLAITLSTLLWADVFNRYILVALLGTLWLGITGFMDDYLKQARKQSKGLTMTAKLTSQIVLGLLVGTILYLSPHNTTQLDVPFFKGCLR